jgi:hypothetical protein
VFVVRVLRRKELRGEKRKAHSEELYYMYSPDIVMVMK